MTWLPCRSSRGQVELPGRGSRCNRWLSGEVGTRARSRSSARSRYTPEERVFHPLEMRCCNARCNAQRGQDNSQQNECGSFYQLVETPVDRRKNPQLRACERSSSCCNVAVGRGGVRLRQRSRLARSRVVSTRLRWMVFVSYSLLWTRFAGHRLSRSGHAGLGRRSAGTACLPREPIGGCAHTRRRVRGHLCSSSPPPSSGHTFGISIPREALSATVCASSYPCI